MTNGNGMKIIIMSIVLLASLCGCDSIDDMKGMFEKQELAQSIIMEKYGWESNLGFNMNNGFLTQVTLILDADDVRGEKVSDLEEIAKEVISHTFKSKPQAIYIQISSIPK